MTQTQSSQGLTPDEYKTQQQNNTQKDSLRSLQEGTPDTTQAVQESMKPQYPNWPTSRPGPLVTPPPPGMKSINAVRREQVAEVGYNQETGTPSTLSPERSMPDESMKGRTGFDQLQTAQEAIKKRKRRIDE